MLINTFPREPVEQLSPHQQTLAVIGFNQLITYPHEDPIPSGIDTPSPSDSLHEWWGVDGDSTITGQSGLCRWTESGDFLFTSICLNADECNDLVTNTYDAYHQLLSFIKQTEHHHLLRFWNYVPAINEGQGDNENYKLFCTGRLKAFGELDVKNAAFPAATAIGHRTTGMTIYGISSVFKGRHHANKKQQNAYQYPREYGLCSPSFARATSLDYPDGRLLFISGTASILGHKTFHEGNLAAQLQVTKDNIMHLLDDTGFTVESMQTMKVYLRYSSDLAEAQAILERDFPGVMKLMTVADICRSDLLVEIECFCA